MGTDSPSTNRAALSRPAAPHLTAAPNAHTAQCGTPRQHGTLNLPRAVLPSMFQEKTPLAVMDSSLGAVNSTRRTSLSPPVGQRYR